MQRPLVVVENRLVYKMPIIKQYLLVLLLYLIVFAFTGCSNVKMACHTETSNKDSSAINSLKDSAQECVKNPTVIVFKEF
jgi:uncharacterized protein (UPF0333 family)